MQSDLTQLTLSAVVNRGLFSNHFLNEVLPRQGEWSLDLHVPVLESIRATYIREKMLLKPEKKEAQIEQHFIRPILHELGFEFEVQEDVGVSRDLPDYALFADRQTLEKAHRADARFYDTALAVAEVKRWEAELDKPGKNKHNIRQNPSFQMWVYLQEVKPLWGILTNGRYWRLYREDNPMDCYFEVDLVTLLETHDTAGFRFFYYFFRKDAFIQLGENKSFLERVLSGSEEYAREIGDNLKENVYRALLRLTQGFFSWEENGLDPTREEDRLSVHQNSMRLLYRLLFVLYAEGRDLLRGDAYRGSAYSLHSLKYEIARRKDGGDQIQAIGTTYWDRLKSLFRLVNKGSEALGIDRAQFYVPPYNGGLFDPTKNSFMETKRLPDPAVADAIDLLARAKMNGGSLGFVDYSTLEIRHLGSIYEGILEYELGFAPEQMVASGKPLVWLPYEQYRASTESPRQFLEFLPELRAERGELFLATKNLERKVTGSYYTPEGIVRFIVKKTLRPVVNEKWKRAIATGGSLKDATLSIRVLDPAMGSGHFLVEAMEFLAKRLYEGVQRDVSKARVSEEEASTWTMMKARREIVSRCIYGSDMNELAVELAKVSLWLATVSLEKPLSFLDHHLKCGNSLIGASLGELAHYPDLARKAKERRGQTSLSSVVPPIILDKLLGKVSELSSVRGDGLQEVKEQERLFEEFKRLPEYDLTRSISDVYTAVFLGNRVGGSEASNEKSLYYRLISCLDRPSELESMKRSSWFRKAMDLARSKKIFHWQLEFPEIFLEKGGVPQESGFDVVIGNPPYVRIYRGRISEIEAKYFSQRFDSAHKKFDLYLLFMEKSLDLLKAGGWFGMIVPDKWMTSPYGEPLRKLVLTHRLFELADLRGTQVFEGVSVSNVIPIIAKVSPSPDDEVTISRPEQTGTGTFEIVPVTSLKQYPMSATKDAQIRVEASGAVSALVSKVRSGSFELERICYVNWGLRTGTKEKTDQMIADSPAGPSYKRLIRGEDLRGRYDLEEVSRFIDYDPSKLYNPMFPEFFENPKLVFRKIAGKKGIFAVLDESGAYGFSTVIVAVRRHNLPVIKRRKVKPPSQESTQYDRLDALLALVNSRLVRWFYDATMSDQLGVNPDPVKALPITRIEFGLEPERRNVLAAEGKAIATRVLEGGRLNEWLAFIEARTSTGRGERPVLLDLLGTLAQEMIVLVRRRRNAVESFLGWVKSPTGIGVADPAPGLGNKLEGALEDLASRLDPSPNWVEGLLRAGKVRLGSEMLGRLSSEYSVLVRAFEECAARIASAESLTNSCVYVLYGLNDAEVALVEGVDVAAVRAKYGQGASGPVFLDDI